MAMRAAVHSGWTTAAEASLYKPIQKSAGGKKNYFEGQSLIIAVVSRKLRS